MKFAVVGGVRQEAQPGLMGECPNGHSMIAKCGQHKMWHWAHKARYSCDPWWENETEWHRAWKGHFPAEWQEIPHLASDGIRHIADVKTERGWVLEFQHSPISTQERSARDAFYPKLVWVVDGTRRKRDAQRFIDSVSNGARLFAHLPVARVRADKCALFQEWAGSSGPVFFDFGNQQLWWLVRVAPDGRAYVGPYSRQTFIDVHRVAAQATDAFEDLAKNLPGLIADFEAHRAHPQYPEPPLPGFQRYLGRRGRFVACKGRLPCPRAE